MLVNPNPHTDTASKANPSPWLDSWYYHYGVNPFGRNGKIPVVKYGKYRGKLISEDEFNDSKTQGQFNHNMCIMIGGLSGHTELLKYARKGLYLNFADFDNELACREFCNYGGQQYTLEEVARTAFIVQHSDDRTHAHVYWLASKPMARRRLETAINKTDKMILDKIRRNELPAIEFKGQGDIAFAPGGYHESGNPYEPIGTTEICIIEELGAHIEAICRKYKLPVSDSERTKFRSLALTAKVISSEIPSYSRTGRNKNKNKNKNKTLCDYLNEDADDEPWSWSDIPESSRNNTLFDRARKYYRKNKDLLSDNSFRKIVHSWNQKYCKPPLSGFEIEGICSSILNHNHNGGQYND